MTPTVLRAVGLDTFLSTYWQKKPLVIRQGLPGFSGLLNPADLLALAKEDDTAVRTVGFHPSRKQHRYQATEGPAELIASGTASTRRKRGEASADTARPLLPERFTFLIQELQQHVPNAWDLLREFSFIPWSRVDDLMVSVASPGGGVGPHVDLYDVFLVQGQGRREWQLDTTPNKQVVLDPNEDLKIISNFTATETHVLEPGDILYLPPNVPHWGTAVDLCTTWSVGFLAPSKEQVVQNFLGYLSQSKASSPKGIYADPDLQARADAAAIVDEDLQRVEQILAALASDRERIADFWGRFLTGPKATAVAPQKPRARSKDDVAAALTRPGQLALTMSARLLFRSHRDSLTLFASGKATTIRATPNNGALKQLANMRTLTLPCTLDDDGVAFVQRLHHQGLCTIGP